MDELKPKNTLASIWTGFDIILIAVGVIFLMLIGIFPVIYYYSTDIQNLAYETTQSLELNLASLILNVLAFSLPVLIVGVWRKVNWRDIGWRSMEAGWWMRAAVIGTAAIFISNLPVLFILVFTGQEFDNPQIDFIVPNGFSWSGLIGMTLLAGVLAPIAEEILFRGVLFRWFRQHFGFWLAALLSSAIFGLVHGIPVVMAGAAVLGLMSAWVYERSGSLWGAVVVHVINNGVKIMLLYMTLPGFILPG